MSTEVFDVQMPDGTIISGVPKGMKQSDVMARYQKMKAPKSEEVTPDVMAARKKASTEAFEKARPGFEGPGLKTALDIPLDIEMGVEQAAGIDPMHPISSFPGAVKGMAKGAVDLATTATSGWFGPFMAAGSMVAPAAQAVKEGGQALRQRNIPEAMQAAGRGYAAVAPLVEPLAAHAEFPSIGDLRETATKLNVPEKLRTRAEINRAPLPAEGVAPWARRTALYAAGHAIGEPHLGEAAVAVDIGRRYQPYRDMKASAQERVARFLDPNNKTPNYRSIEEKIGPSGERAQRGTQMVNDKSQPTPFGRDLLKEVPELEKAPKGPQADAALMSGYQRVLQRVVETENSIPENTTVDKTPIVSQLGALEAEYLEQGLTKTADAIHRMQSEWLEAGGADEMPWGEFIRRKRAFFDEHNLNSNPMRRAYGILMEASGRVSPELNEANHSYSTVRRALDSAKIDVKTGRRLSRVGKPSTIEEIKQRTTLKKQGVSQPVKKPVTNRAEAINALKTEPTPASEPESETPQEEPEQEPAIVPPGSAPSKLTRPTGEAVGKVGAGIRGEASSLTQTVDSRMRMIQEIAESGATETTGKFIGREGRESGSANYGTEEGRRAGSSFLQHFPELESLGRTPSVIAKAIRQGKGPLYTQIREIVKDAMQDELQSLSGTGRGPGALRERALGVMRQRLQAP